MSRPRVHWLLLDGEAGEGITGAYTVTAGLTEGWRCLFLVIIASWQNQNGTKIRAEAPPPKCDGANVGKDLPTDSPAGTCPWSLKVFPNESACPGRHKEELAGFAPTSCFLSEPLGFCIRSETV